MIVTVHTVTITLNMICITIRYNYYTKDGY